MMEEKIARMLMNPASDTQFLQLCRPQRIVISVKCQSNRGILSGKCNLYTRLYDVKAFRVRSFNISSLAADYNAEQGAILVLSSSYLASSLSSPPLQFALSTDDGINMAFPCTAIATTTRNATTNDYASASLNNTTFNNDLHEFARAQPLDSFDWTISPLNGNFPQPFTHNYTIEIEIDFYTLCKCQTRLKLPEGSL